MDNPNVCFFFEYRFNLTTKLGLYITTQKNNQTNTRFTNLHFFDNSFFIENQTDKNTKKNVPLKYRYRLTSIKIKLRKTVRQYYTKKSI